MSYPPPNPGMPMQQQAAWAPPPQMERPSNCPPGLEYLLHVDQLLVKQQVELFEAFTGFETSNKYKVTAIFTKFFLFLIYFLSIYVQFLLILLIFLYFLNTFLSNFFQFLVHISRFWTAWASKYSSLEKRATVALASAVDLFEASKWRSQTIWDKKSPASKDLSIVHVAAASAIFRASFKKWVSFFLSFFD